MSVLCILVILNLYCPSDDHFKLFCMNLINNIYTAIALVLFRVYFIWNSRGVLARMDDDLNQIAEIIGYMIPTTLLLGVIVGVILNYIIKKSDSIKDKTKFKFTGMVSLGVIISFLLDLA